MAGPIVAEGEYIACQTWIEGTFVRPFTQSPAGRLEPTGARVVMDLMNIFRFDDEGRLVEEYVRTDYRSLLRQLGTDEIEQLRGLPCQQGTEPEEDTA